MVKVALVSSAPLSPQETRIPSLRYYKVDECVPGPNPICNHPSLSSPFCRGKEAGVFNKVIALLLYFPFINYKELGAECGRRLAQREGYRTGWECKLVRALSESKLAMPSKVAASWLPFPAQLPQRLEDTAVLSKTATHWGKMRPLMGS